VKDDIALATAIGHWLDTVATGQPTGAKAYLRSSLEYAAPARSRTCIDFFVAKMPLLVWATCPE
jgi:hypothetical protein